MEAKNNAKIGTGTKRPNPVQGANLLSEITFLYMFPIFKKSMKEKLTEDDLYLPLKEHKSSRLGSNLEKIFKEEFRIHKKTALHRALFKLLCWPFILLGIAKLFTEMMLIVVLPLTIGKLVSYFERGQTRITEKEAYIYAAALILCLLVDCFVSHPAMMGLQHLSMKLRIATSSLLYRKVLTISKSALGTVTVGQLVNLLSNDVSKFDQGFILAHFVWVGPIQVAVGTWLLYKEIDAAAYFGVAFLVSFVPLQMWLAKRVSVLRLRTALRTDERVRLMDEVIAGIQVIKMYCWEKPFAQLVSMARRKEMKAIRSHSCILGLIYSFEQFVSRTSIFISILGYVMLGNYVTAEKVFAITALYNVMRPVITILFSISLTSIAEVNISIRRVQEVLACEERTPNDNNFFLIKEGIKNNGTMKMMKKTRNDDLPPKIELKQVTAKWSDESPEDTLHGITLNVSQGELLAIIGPVGSGKSSIINLLLKELPIKSGHLNVLGRISYASQEPWLFTGSIRQNILFDEEYEEDRYQAVIEVCALGPDLAMFSHGDKTLVGEKGKSLSGGQKARINLARCVYKSADIYLLDDPLSAVDANVGKHLYEKCIKSFLSKKICVLVTHQLQYLKNADNIVIMSNGGIQLEGKYQELQRSGLDFAKLLEEFHSEEVNEEEKKKIKSRQNSEMMAEEEDEEEEQTLEKERQGSGRISKGVYWKYLRAGGGTFTVIFVIFLFFFSQAVANGGEYFVTFWVNLEENLAHSNESYSIDRNKIVYWYTALTLGTALIAISKEVYFLLFLATASKNLHDYIFSRIIKATMTFYNSNPSGRILNRFSKDLGVIDEYIPSVLIDVIEIALLLGGTIVLSAIIDPWLLLPSMGLILLFYFLRLIYIETSRSVKRVESITKSPVFSHVTATVNGLSTIRACSAEEMLIREFDELQDIHSSAWFLFIASSRCFGFWLDMICITFIALGLVTLLFFNDKIQGGDLGLVLTQYIGLMGSLQWGMRQWSELENQMTSVERVLEYTKLEQEPEREERPLPVEWPSKGRVEFIQVRLRYDESDPAAYVLKGLNFTVNPEEKIGIVGRTGAGKSSTISALFQLYKLEGRILIDDIDTTLLPLHRVRPVIAIIPQEPILFSGTMRRNLDPFEEYGDETLWRALDQVELKDFISDLPSGLNTNVTEGGTNFSVGQRQLVCLARALIRNNKILVLDEATANVDPHTDALIQQTIRDKFRNCTVLTIAHRLHTVMDSDKILVMESGSVVEYAHPYELLQKERGTLRTLVDTTGPATAKNLENIARESYQKRKTS